MKVCRNCGTEFSGRCKPCQQKWYQDYRRRIAPEISTRKREYHQKNSEIIHEKKKAYYLKNRETILAKRIGRLYGITPDAYSRLLESQGGACAICKEKRGRLMIDHCHGSGVVRGLLCIACNLGIGYFWDKPDALEAAKDYLVKYGNAGTSKEYTGFGRGAS